jgi:uncharacterized protein (TIGR04255 family)
MTSKKSRKLSNAPLAEVIFELRWALENRGTGDAQLLQLGHDPAYPLLARSFPAALKKLGYDTSKFVGQANIPFSFPYTIETRFYKKASPFPLMQIGMGIFASNSDGKHYEWDEFKKQILAGVNALSQSYPQGFALAPVVVDLKYVNFFDPQVLSNKKNTTFLDFINKETSARMTVPDFSFAKSLIGFNSGRLQLKSPLRTRKNTSFMLDVANVDKDGVRSIRIESRVTTEAVNGITFKIKKLETFIDTWLDEAHEVLSPFFEEFVPEIVSKSK